MKEEQVYVLSIATGVVVLFGGLMAVSTASNVRNSSRIASEYSDAAKKTITKKTSEPAVETEQKPPVTTEKKPPAATGKKPPTATAKKPPRSTAKKHEINLVFTQDGLTRVDQHDNGATAFYHGASGKLAPKIKVVATNKHEINLAFVKEGLTRVDQHGYGATAFYHGATAGNDKVWKAPTFHKENLTHVEEHANGATAFYLE